MSASGIHHVPLMDIDPRLKTSDITKWSVADVTEYFSTINSDIPPHVIELIRQHGVNGEMLVKESMEDFGDILKHLSDEESSELLWRISAVVAIHQTKQEIASARRDNNDDNSSVIYIFVIYLSG